MKEMKINLSDEARRLRNEYLRNYLKNYFKKHPEKRKQYIENYWERKARKLRENQQSE